MPNAKRELRGPAAAEPRAQTGLNGWPPSAPRNRSVIRPLSTSLRRSSPVYPYCNNLATTLVIERPQGDPACTTFPWRSIT